MFTIESGCICIYHSCVNKSQYYSYFPISFSYTLQNPDHDKKISDAFCQSGLSGDEVFAFETSAYDQPNLAVPI